MQFLIDSKKKGRCRACKRKDVAYYASGMCKTDYVGFMRQRRIWRDEKRVQGKRPYCTVCGVRSNDVKPRGKNRELLCCAACEQGRG